MITLVIDSNYIAHQARYTMGDLGVDSIPTGVVFGFLSRVLSLGQMFSTNDFVFCWDSRSSKRKSMCLEYKSKRHKDLSDEERENMLLAFKQFTLLRKRILPSIGFNNVHVQRGYEADDIIARLVLHSKGTFVVVTADEDMLQILRGNVRIWNPSRKVMTTQASFKETYGISPVEWAQVKSIAGCGSDNVKGIFRVGEKTAASYLRGELKQTSVAYKAIVSPEGKGIARRNAPLVTLPLHGTHTPKRLENSFSMKRLVRVCHEYGFASFLEEDRKDQWRQFFAGHFDKPSKVVINKRRRST